MSQMQIMNCLMFDQVQSCEKLVTHLLLIFLYLVMFSQLHSLLKWEDNYK